jgi:hypothetical protein
MFVCYLFKNTETQYGVLNLKDTFVAQGNPWHGSHSQKCLLTLLRIALPRRLRLLSRETQLNIRWQFDDDVIDTAWYGPRMLEAILTDHTQCGSLKMWEQEICSLSVESSEFTWIFCLFITVACTETTSICFFLTIIDPNNVKPVHFKLRQQENTKIQTYSGRNS